MSTPELIRRHAVVGQSSGPRADRLSRRVDVWSIFGESDRRAVSATVGDRYTTTASAEAVGLLMVQASVTPPHDTV